MNLSVRIHLNCWELILVGLECQYKQKGAVQFEPPFNGCSFQNAVVNPPASVSKG
jgi:hypothetical protein